MNNTTKILISVGALATIGALCYLKRANDKELKIRELLVLDKNRAKDTIGQAVENLEKRVNKSLEYNIDFDAPYKIEAPEFIYE